MAKLSNFDEVSDQKGFILVYPDGVGHSWNAGNGAGAAERRQVDDVGFTSELIDELSRQFHIDRRRIYATGMSNGGMFVHRLACELSGKIAAVAPVAGTIAATIEEGCKPARPVPVLEIHGTADSDSPWAGGRTLGGGQVVSVADTIRGWAARNQCASTPKVTEPATGVTCETYTPCEGGAEVTLYRIEGGGHTWPGGYQYLPKMIVGETNRSVSASQIIWDFFERHPMKEH
jgi:polyhydroxybutyrate depolymerase